MDPPQRPALWPYAFAATLLGLPLLYVLSDGPGIYAVEVGWLEFDTVLAIWGPVPDWVGLAPVDAYEGWWSDLAASHGGQRR